MKLHIAIRAALMLPFAAAALTSSALAADWPQFGYDAAHTGFNTAETAINAGNVASLTSAFAGGIALPAKVDGAPVYKSGVTTPSGVKNLLFAFGSDGISDFSASIGTLVAIDAQTGQIVWSKETDGTSHSSSQHASASPAIDPDGQYVYSFGLDGYVHKYAIGDGAEVTDGGPTGWPQQVTLKPDVEKSASSLTIAPMGGAHYLVVVTDGYDGDGGDYQGHLVSINLANGAKTVFNFMCSDVPMLLANGGCSSGRESGAWGRGGATYDAGSGRIFATSGNGHFNANTSGGTNWGDSVLAFTADGGGSGNGAPLDSYTPDTFQNLDDADLDLGSVSLAILKAPAGSAVAHVGVQTGKDGKARLIDLDDMSGAGGPRHVGGELQTLDVPQGGMYMKEQPATWVDGNGDGWAFIGTSHGLSGLKLGLGAGNVPTLSTVWQNTVKATSPVVANGVLYTFGACSGGNCVLARDAASGNLLWTSPVLGGLHWQSPIVVDGAVFVIDGDSKLWKFSGPSGSSDPIFADGFDG